MKILNLFLCLQVYFGTQPLWAENATGHKMTLWSDSAGDGKLYLNHWAMFHSPHDRQVIIEVEMSAAQKAIYKAAIRSDEFMSIDPEVFHLGNFLAAPHDLRATVYQGHAERGGTVIEGLEDVTFKVKKILYQRTFDPNDHHSGDFNAAVYVLFGAGDGKYYVAHKIRAVSEGAHPEFDKILEVQLEDGVKAAVDLQLAEKKSLELTLPAQDNLSPLMPANQVMAQNPALAAPLVLKVLREIYFETQDFSF